LLDAWRTALPLARTGGRGGGNAPFVGAAGGSMTAVAGKKCP